MKYQTGANESEYDIRTFVYDYAGDEVPNSAGESWANTEFIEDQHRVGICTAISMAMRARKHFNMDFSDDFQYLLQKKFIDGNWNEGSSGLSACKVGQKYGFLPASKWTFTTIDDRKLTYSKYIKKLQAVTDEQIQELLIEAAKYKVLAYAKIPNTVESLRKTIEDTGAVTARFVVGREWYTSPIEPLQNPLKPISGHLVNITKAVGDSYRIANSWGTDWADGGTAYGLFSVYKPTEMWQVWFTDIPKEIQVKLDGRTETIGKILNQIQLLINILKKK